MDWTTSLPADVPNGWSEEGSRGAKMEMELPSSFRTVELLLSCSSKAGGWEECLLQFLF